MSSDNKDVVKDFKDTKEDLEDFNIEHHIITEQQCIVPHILYYPKETNIYLWIHSGLRKCKITDLPKNLSFGEKLQEEGIVGNVNSVIYFTSGDIDELRERIKSSRSSRISLKSSSPSSIVIFDKKEKKQKTICGLNIFIEEINNLPQPSKPVDFLPKNRTNQQTHNTSTLPSSEPVESLPKSKSKRSSPLKTARVTFKNENDFGVQLFRDTLGNGVIENILGETIGKDKGPYGLDILTPGYSGAYVLKVKAHGSGDEPNNYLLKISRNKQELKNERSANERNVDNNLSDGEFPPILSRYSKDDIQGWACNVYSFRVGDSLRNILKNQLIYNEKINDSIIRTVIKTHGRFERKYRLILTPDLNPLFLDDKGVKVSKNEQIRYDGLILDQKKRSRILFNLESIKSICEKMDEGFVKRLFSESWDLFVEWIERMDTASKYKGKKLDLTADVVTPTSIVHGDFHTANIIMNANYSQASIIDFANMPDKPIKHSFIDLGKLSADLEISVMPENEILGDIKRLEKWCYYHKKWLDEDRESEKNSSLFEDIAPNDIDALFDSFYNTQEIILREGLIGKKNIHEERRYKMDKAHVIRQFQMVRLHYFLKAISYDNTIREKTFFLIKASMDILDYLIGNKG